MLKKHFIRLGIVGAVLTPAVASAQAFEQLRDIVVIFGDIIDLLLPIVFALAILAFFYGIFLYVWGQSGESKVQGKNVMIWALVAIFVMASLFGIIQLAQGTLGIDDNSGDFEIPGVEGL